MKRNIFKSIAVIAAFFIGLSINESCGDTPFDENISPSSSTNAGSTGQNASEAGDTEELWKTLRNLTAELESLKQQSTQQQQEISRLNTEIAGLKQNGSNASGGEFYVDGLYFSRGGYVNSKIKQATNNGTSFVYTYDSQGRIQSYKAISNGFTLTTSYTYSGKTATITQRTEYDPGVYPNQQNTTGTTTYEYY